MNTKCLATVTLLLLALAAAPALIAESYTMKDGDTLWEIARTKYGDPSFYTDLQKANGIGDPRAIPIGTVIQLPSKQTLLKLRGVTDPAERQKILKGETTAGVPPQPAGPTAFDPVQGLSSRVEVPRTGGSTTK